MEVKVYVDGGSVCVEFQEELSLCVVEIVVEGGVIVDGEM